MCLVCQVTIYADEDGARKEDIAALRGDNVFSNFYDRLKEMRDYHRRFSNDELTGPEEEADAAMAAAFAPTLPFSGEEGLGRYLDLLEHHAAWVNAKFGAQIEYHAYVAGLATHLDDIPRPQRLTRPYAAYTEGLLAYMRSFHERTQPLAPLDAQWARLRAEFDAQWEAGEVPGWEDRGEGPTPDGATTDAAGAAAIDLDAFDSAEALEAVGPDALKAALTALGLKCGGTVAQRAQRLFATKGKSRDQLDPSLFAKGTAGKAAANGGTANGATAGEAARAAA